VSRSVRITLAGQQLAVKTDVKPRYLKELVAYVDRKIDDARAGGKVVTTQRLALLAAVSLADELFRLREEHRRLRREVAERSRRILRQLDAEAGA
jgi:cell division protein ZapA (FtsZ GTPase activity inhibitor)